MKHELHSSGHKHLTVFFAGWGMDSRIFKDIMPHDRDMLFCYDYSDLMPDMSLFDGYDTITLTGWSMGVWAACRVMPRHKDKIIRATAINGTGMPVDDCMGIPQAIFSGTLSGLSEKSLDKFRLRMCGNRQNYMSFMENAPLRDLQDLTMELASTGKGALEHPMLPAEASKLWTCAIVCSEDRIFPAANQLAYWKQAAVSTIEIKGPHYCPEVIFDAITK